MLKNVSTAIEASATGESLNSGDPAVHPAARHRSESVPLLGGKNARGCIPSTQPTETPLSWILAARCGDREQQLHGEGRTMETLLAYPWDYSRRFYATVWRTAQPVIQ